MHVGELSQRICLSLLFGKVVNERNRKVGVMSEIVIVRNRRTLRRFWRRCCPKRMVKMPVLTESISVGGKRIETLHS